MSSRAYVTKPSDDDTVASDDNSVEMAAPVAAATSSFSIKKRNRLTTISRKYDLDGDGVLDEAEQAMRDRDVANRGFLTNEEIYTIVQDQLRAKRSAGYMRRLVAGLICFVVILALSNLGTSLAAAFLAKDLTADEGNESTNGVPAMRIVETGEIAAAQTTADTFTEDEVTSDEIDARRRRVLREMEEDPHSHAHRRDLRGNKDCQRDDVMEACDGSRSRITLDSTRMRESDFDRMEDGCRKQRNVYFKKKWGDSVRNECICSRGTSVVVKEKRTGKKGTANKKKKKGKKGSRNREVIIEREDGRIMHVDCEDGECWAGGPTLQGELGDACRIGSDECGLHKGRHLICSYDTTSKKNNKKNNKNVRARTSSSWGVCLLPTVEVIEYAKPQRRSGLRGDYCLVDKRDECDVDLWCEPDDLDDVITARRAGRNAGYGGNGGGAWNQGVVIAGPSGVIDTRQNGGYGNNGSTNRAPRSSSRTGTCQRAVGYGQTCDHDGQCGREGYCDGLSFGGMVGQQVIQGASGTIVHGGSWVAGSAGVCRGR